MIDFIQGEKFQTLADNIKIFYCKTGDVNRFLQNPPKENFVLISHNSDACVTYKPQKQEDADANLVPNNLVKWFAQNVNCVHNKIESIPIGLENSQWFPEIRKKEKIENKVKESINIINLLYINHNIFTNIIERQEPYQIFNKNWVTLESGQNGLNFDKYIHNIYNHKFVLSPRGNGMDTHRLWEILYLGTIPIEKNNLNNRFYQDLPICFVNDWREITPEFLEYEYDRIKNKEWNFEKMTFKYWKQKIGRCLC